MQILHTSPLECILGKNDFSAWKKRDTVLEKTECNCIPEYMPIIQWSVMTCWCLRVLEYFFKFDLKPEFNGLSSSQYHDFSLITLMITLCSSDVFLNFFLLITDPHQSRSLSDSAQYYTSITWPWRELYIAAFPWSLNSGFW